MSASRRKKKKAPVGPKDGRWVSDRMPDNCLSHVSRVETAAMLPQQRALPFGFAEGLCKAFHQRPSLRGFDGEFFQAGEPIPFDHPA